MQVEKKFNVYIYIRCMLVTKQMLIFSFSLNNPILEGGFEIICSPSTSPGNLDGVRKALQVCQVELHPFFICGHDGKAPLNSQVCTEREGVREGERE